MALKDQRRGHKAIESIVHQTHTPSLVDSQYCVRTKEGWKGKNVRGFRGFKQNLP